MYTVYKDKTQINNALGVVAEWSKVLIAVPRPLTV